MRIFVNWLSIVGFKDDALLPVKHVNINSRDVFISLTWDETVDEIAHLMRQTVGREVPSTLQNDGEMKHSEEIFVVIEENLHKSIDHLLARVNILSDLIGGVRKKERREKETDFDEESAVFLCGIENEFTLPHPWRPGYNQHRVWGMGEREDERNAWRSIIVIEYVWPRRERERERERE